VYVRYVYETGPKTVSDSKGITLHFWTRQIQIYVHATFARFIVTHLLTLLKYYNYTIFMKRALWSVQAKGKSKKR